MEEFSSFLGLTSFKSLEVSSVRFQTLMDYSAQAVSVFDTSNSTNFFYHFSYLSMNNYALGCPTTYPYKLGTNSSGLCYSSIPPGYYYNSTLGQLKPYNCSSGQYMNTSSNQCSSCKVTCLACVNADNCSSCDEAKHRVLSNASQQCEPEGGYYESGVAEALACSPGCDRCLSASTCLECENNTNRYLNNGSCVAEDGFYTVNGSVTALPCSVTCLTCSGAAGICTSCNSSLNRALNASSSSCEPERGFYESGAAEAAACPPGCASCLSFSLCLECDNNTNLVLQNNSCMAAPGFYTANGSTTVLPCSPACLTCAGTAFSCTSCNSSLNRELNTSTSSCEPMPGFY
jgi:hypothetical protein